tara:strand:+ start:77 stop:220 length:144 start_codon:yes stop_codon:yes gene_type:complete
LPVIGLLHASFKGSGFAAANLLLASVQKRQLPVVAYAFAEYLSRGPV